MKMEGEKNNRYYFKIEMREELAAVAHLSEPKRTNQLRKNLEKKYPDIDWSNIKPPSERSAEVTPERTAKYYFDMEMRKALGMVEGMHEPARTNKLREILEDWYPEVDWSGIQTPSDEDETESEVTEKRKDKSGKSSKPEMTSMDYYKLEADRIWEELKKVAPEKREKLLREILRRDYGIETESKIKRLMSKISLRHVALGLGAPMLIASFLLLNKNKLPADARDGDPDKKERYEPPEKSTPAPVDSIGTAPPEVSPGNPNPEDGGGAGGESIFPKRKFDQMVFNVLPPQGQEIYRTFYEHDPSPGSNYGFLDKESALVYIFDAENNLVARVVAGFGQTPGDAPNNAYASGFDRGNMTTPQGAYLFDAITVSPENLREYEGFGISLQGTSVNGNQEYLGMHQTYPKELRKRSGLLATPSPYDNAFSNGCINIPKDAYVRYIAPLFEGNFTELFFVLGDRYSGFKMNARGLIGLKANTLYEKAQADWNDLASSMRKTRPGNLQILEQAKKRIKEMEESGAPQTEIDKAKQQLEVDTEALLGEDRELKGIEARMKAAQGYMSVQ